VIWLCSERTDIVNTNEYREAGSSRPIIDQAGFCRELAYPPATALSCASRHRPLSIPVISMPKPVMSFLYWRTWRYNRPAKKGPR